MVNIDAQHEQVIEALNPYWDEMRRWQRYVFGFAFRQPLRFVTSVWPYFLAQQRQSAIDRLSGKTDESLRAAVRAIYVRERAEEQEQFFEDLLGDYSLHVIAERMQAKFPDFDFSKIKKLHDARRADRLQLSMHKLITVVLTVAAFMGKSVPKVVIEDDFHLAYANYERGLFYGTCVLLAYAGLLVLTEWTALRRAKAKHDYFAGIISYIDIASAKPKAS